jgi:hypothetical protein
MFVFCRLAVDRPAKKFIDLFEIFMVKEQMQL